MAIKKIQGTTEKGKKITKSFRYPAKYKGNKVTPEIYKVRTDTKGRDVITIGLYYKVKIKGRKSPRKELLKNIIIKF